MNATTTARAALDAYQAQHRGRRAFAILDRASDALLALGALLVVNGLLPLGVGLPAGPIGMSAGGALLAAALGWMRRPARPVRRIVAEPIAVASVSPFYAQHVRNAA